MPRKNDDLLKKLLATFRVEADEHLRAMSSGLLAIEGVPIGAEHAELIEKIFREAHSLKGAARAVNLSHVESVCQSLESVFAGLKRKEIAASSPLLDLLHQAIGVLEGLAAADPSAPPAHLPEVAALVRRLDDALSDARRGPEAPPPAASIPTTAAAEGSPVPPSAHKPLPVPDIASETVRVATTKLDAVMRQVEELLSPRLALTQRAKDLREIAMALVAWKKERARIQPALLLVERAFTHSAKLDGARERLELPRLLGYLDAEQLHLKTLEGQLTRLVRTSERDRRALAGLADGLLDEVKRMQLLPFSSLLEIFPRLVRDLAREHDKEARVTIHGGEIEVDRRILEELKDPLIHLVRNAVDHGIEPPDARAAAGKPAQGAIELAVAQTDSGKIEIRIADDGAGIDVAKVVAAASKQGLIPPEEAERLDPVQSQALVFRSGLSTSPIVTDVSGRGLGLAIVREKVERLGGSIELHSQPDTGTAFRIVVPLTLATLRGVLVRSGQRLYLVPAANLERAVRVRTDAVQTVENRETIAVGEQALALVGLGEVLELPRPPPAAQAPAFIQALVLGLNQARIAFRVDEILGEQEVLLKPLGPQLARIRNVAGASTLGSGQVVPVLNVPDLMRSAVRRATAPATPIAPAPSVAAAQRSILVVEDSITSRALLKGILESAGYRVAGAVDGIDAYTALKTERFDLVVSDVEMPRMDGFDLTARIRADKHLAELPVVLVTALETREHRERGIEAGANAYLVKSSFDQSNLLEVVARLMP